MADLQTIKNKLGIIGTSPALHRAIEIALRVAVTDLSVLVTGESGVGKEFFPKIIHMNSSRKHEKYIAVNCGAIPEGTIDSELFGHEKGAFTGAVESRKGYFEEADGGTIFLDEIAELPLTTQVRLLRVLQSGEFIRVGSSKAQKTNVRVIAATNVNLQEAMLEGRFREDLYYRLNTVPVEIPSLRQRKEDIMLLFRRFTSAISEQYRFPRVELDENAQSLLENYSWPGNIRQLKNISEQIATLEQGHKVTSDILKKYLGDFGSSDLPIIHPSSSTNSSKGVDSTTERDLLYRLLFDLKDEVSELKRMVCELQQGGAVSTSPKEDTVQSPAMAPGISSGIASGIVPEPQWSEAEEIVDFTSASEIPSTKEDMMRRQIMEALRKNKGNRRGAAKDLWISERTLYRRIKKLGIAEQF